MLKRAFMTMAAAAAVTAALTFGAAAAENEKIQAGGLVFEIPAEYKDLVTVQTEGLQPDELIRVSETASIEAAKANGANNPGAGWLFTISRVSEEELEIMRCYSMDGMEVFAKNDVDDGEDYYLIYNQSDDIRNTVYQDSFLERKDKYAYFYGGNFGLIQAKMPEHETGRKLLVIKDSYAHCFVPFTYALFDQVDMLDTRYYNASISALIGQENYTDILFLFNAAGFAEETSLARLMS